MDAVWKVFEIAGGEMNMGHPASRLVKFDPCLTSPVVAGWRVSNTVFVLLLTIRAHSTQQTVHQTDSCRKPQTLNIIL